jgi:hypothetical protein
MIAFALLPRALAIEEPSLSHITITGISGNPLSPLMKEHISSTAIPFIERSAIIRSAPTDSWIFMTSSPDEAVNILISPLERMLLYLPTALLRLPETINFFIIFLYDHEKLFPVTIIFYIHI